MTVGPSKAAGKNMLWNGTFDGETLRPWNVGLESTESGRAAVANHELCVQIDRPGPSAASVAVRQRPLALFRGHHYQLRFSAHATKATRLRVRLSKNRRALHRAVGGDGRGGARGARLRGHVRRHGRRGERGAGSRSRRRADGRRAAHGLPRRCRAERSPGGAADRTPEPAPDPQGAGQPGRLPAGPAQNRDGREHGRGGCGVDWFAAGRASRLAAGRCPRPPARQRKDAPLRRRPFVGRAGSADRFLVGHRDGRRVQAAGGRRGERAVRHRRGRLPAAQVRRAGVLLPAAERDPDQDALRGLARLRTRGRSPRRQERRLRAGEPLRLFARRQRRLVRRRRSRQVRGQRRLFRLAPAERIRDALAFRHHGGRVRRREDEDPRVAERPPRPARRGALGARSLLAAAGAGRAADGRDGPSEDSWGEVVEHSDLARPRRHPTLPAARQHRGDPESGGGGRPGGPAVAKARSRPSRRAA